jgi:hypothetical protein
MAANIQPIAPDIGFGTWQDGYVQGGPGALTGIEAASQTWKIGAPLVNSSGKLAEASTSTSAKSGIIGIALAPASGITNNPVQYVPLCPDGLSFQGTIDGTLSSSNAPGTGSLAQSGMYGGGTLQKDAASGLWFFNNTATGDFIFVAAVSPLGTVNGRVRAVFLHAISITT